MSAAHRVYAYARVSTGEQSVENQRGEVSAAGFEVPPHRFLSDEVSGKVPALERKAFARLLDRLEPGDTLVVSKLDRLGRDSHDLEGTLRLLEGKGVSVVVLQLGKTDLTSTAGQMIRKVLGAVAQMERDLLVERTRSGMARAKLEGRAIGRPRKTTPAQREAIRKQAAGGASISSLAREYRISRASVLVVIRKADGIKPAKIAAQSTVTKIGAAQSAATWATKAAAALARASKK